MLPLLLEVPKIHRRLLQIFPEGTPQRTYCTREMAARTVFVMLYIGAIEGSGMWTAPKHVYRMGPGQAAHRSDQDRQAYIAAVEKRGSELPMGRWFQDNTREPIRDETLRDGLVRVGAVVTRPGLATTSSKGRYALQSAFASLFDPTLEDTRSRPRLPRGRTSIFRPGRSRACACSSVPPARRNPGCWLPCRTARPAKWKPAPRRSSPRL